MQMPHPHLGRHPGPRRRGPSCRPPARRRRGRDRAQASSSLVDRRHLRHLRPCRRAARLPGLSGGLLDLPRPEVRGLPQPQRARLQRRRGQGDRRPATVHDGPNDPAPAQRFHSTAGLPLSWINRLYNLRTFFWPVLFSDDNWILGVRPSARVAAPGVQGGFTWMRAATPGCSRGGGIPLARQLHRVRRRRDPARAGLGRRANAAGIVATAVTAAMCSQVVIMAFDPHLTFRGSATRSSCCWRSSADSPRGRARRSASADPRRPPSLNPWGCLYDTATEIRPMAATGHIGRDRRSMADPRQPPGALHLQRGGRRRAKRCRHRRQLGAQT